MMKEIIQKIKDWFTPEDRRSKCYCVCGNEVLQDPESKFYDAGSTTSIICSQCNGQSTWDLNAPVPLLLHFIK